MKDVYIHPAAIAEAEKIGEGTRIWAFTHVLRGASIGSQCNIGEQCFIESGVVVGNCVTIKNGNSLWDGITLADGVFVGPNVTFTNDLWPRSPRLPQARPRYSAREWLAPTTVGQGASIGAGAVIIAGITIGEFAMVGAGAVVTRSVPPHALVVGVPARIIGWVCECGRRVELQDGAAACEPCGRHFVHVAETGRSTLDCFPV
jgi:UDP-2-acetamido-3-amino-2,3-dideoxy-glucuronate N-acetyltransferase